MGVGPFVSADYSCSHSTMMVVSSVALADIAGSTVNHNIKTAIMLSPEIALFLARITL